MPEFQYKQRKTTDSYLKGIERIFGSPCPINIDNPQICSAGTCNSCIEFKENSKAWEKEIETTEQKQTLVTNPSKKHQ